MCIRDSYYRGLNLIITTYKIYRKIIRGRLGSVSAILFLDEQAGLRKSLSYIHDLFSLKMLVEKIRDLIYRHTLLSFTMRKRLMELTDPLYETLCIIGVILNIL